MSIFPWTSLLAQAWRALHTDLHLTKLAPLCHMCPKLLCDHAMSMFFKSSRDVSFKFIFLLSREMIVSYLGHLPAHVPPPSQGCCSFLAYGFSKCRRVLSLSLNSKARAWVRHVLAGTSHAIVANFVPALKYTLFKSLVFPSLPPDFPFSFSQCLLRRLPGILHCMSSQNLRFDRTSSRLPSSHIFVHNTLLCPSPLPSQENFKIVMPKCFFNFPYTFLAASVAAYGLLIAHETFVAIVHIDPHFGAKLPVTLP